MSKLTVIKRDGTHVSLDGEAGVSVMENIRSSGIDEILAICGGCLLRHLPCLRRYRCFRGLAADVHR